MGDAVTAEPVFMFSDSLRYGALRALEATDTVVGTTATAMAERLMKQRRYAEAARTAILGRRWRAASQALRYAVARGDMSFNDLLGDHLSTVSYRDALADPFLGVVAALSARGHLIDSARDELLARGVTETENIGEHDEVDLAPDSSPAEAAFELALWRSAIELTALRALGDWPGLAAATRSAIAGVAATPKPVLAAAGALRSFIGGQIELSLALLGEPEYRTTARHRRLSIALDRADVSTVLGSVALAAAIRGEVAEAKTALQVIDAEGDHRLPPAPEYVLAKSLISLEERDDVELRRVLGAGARTSDPWFDDLSGLIRARYLYMCDQGARSLDALRSVARAGTTPLAHAEAVAFRIERYLAEGLVSQAQKAIEEVQRTPYARWHVVRLALARSRFAQDQIEAGMKIAESVWSSDSATPRHQARALAFGVACAERLGDRATAERLREEARFFCLRGGMQEPYDDLPPDARADSGAFGIRLRPELPMPLERIVLTKRELAVLRALNERSSADEIAALLHVSKNTVKTQLRHLYRKLGAHSREEALQTATDEGLM